MKRKILQSVSTLFLIMALALLSCSRRDGAESLLLTVPSSTNGVAVVDMKRVLSGAGVKVSDGNVEIPDSMCEALSFLPDGDCGIIPTYSVVFLYKGAFVVTFPLSDAGLFAEKCSGRSGVSFSSKDGLSVSSDGRMVLSDTQGWWSSSGIAPADVASFMDLKEAGSVMSGPYAGYLLAGGNDIRCVGRLSAFGAFSGDPSVSMKIQGIASLLLDDACFLASEVDLRPGALEATATFLDSKGRPARTALALRPVDVKRISGMGLRGEMFVALSPDPSLTGRLLDGIGALAGIPAGVDRALRGLDGDMVLALSLNDTVPRYPLFSFVATFSDASAAASAGDFISLLTGESGTVRPDGNLLHIDSGTPSGLPFAEVAPRFEGALGGAYMSEAAMPLVYSAPWTGMFRDASVMIVPSGESMDVRLRLTTVPGCSAAVALMKAVAADGR